MTLVISHITGRDNITQLLPPEGIGVEIGTHIGEFAEQILNTWNGTLICVDPWKIYPEYKEQYQFLWGRENGNFFEQASKRLEKFKHRCQLIRLTSGSAVSLIPTKLDFVYIDGNHSYRYVKQDLELWYPKLESKGIIAGHDFFMPGAIIDNMQDEVQQAVIEFANTKALDIHIIPEIGEHPWSYYMIKP